MELMDGNLSNPLIKAPGGKAAVLKCSKRATEGQPLELEPKKNKAVAATAAAAM